MTPRRGAGPIAASQVTRHKIVTPMAVIHAAENFIPSVKVHRSDDVARELEFFCDVPEMPRARRVLVIERLHIRVAAHGGVPACQLLAPVEGVAD